MDRGSVILHGQGPIITSWGNERLVSSGHRGRGEWGMNEKECRLKVDPSLMYSMNIAKKQVV